MNTSTFEPKLSLYIPRVFPNWRDEARMANVFESLNIGKIHRIDFIDKIDENTNQSYCQAFVHFEYWYDYPASHSIQEKILDPTQQAKIVYDDPWFWLLLKCNKPLTDTEKKMEERVYALEKQVEVQAHAIAILAENGRFAAGFEVEDRSSTASCASENCGGCCSLRQAHAEHWEDPTPSYYGQNYNPIEEPVASPPAITRQTPLTLQREDSFRLEPRNPAEPSYDQNGKKYKYDCDLLGWFTDDEEDEEDTQELTRTLSYHPSRPGNAEKCGWTEGRKKFTTDMCNN
jgi:hypothetical protein